MPDFELATRDDFQKMVDAQIEETLTLEYKASPALTRDSKNVLELCKDVSAMANSAGGQIIYGIEEDKKTHKPSRVDNGVTDEKITREWLHQILTSNIQPRVDGIMVQRVQLSANGYGFVILVPPTQTGPHQASDKKYYKRFELEAVAMQDYEIRDIMRRSTAPVLRVELGLSGGKRRALPMVPNQDVSNPFPLFISVSNLSTTPALYSRLTLGIDPNLFIQDNTNLSAIGKYTDADGLSFGWYRRNFAVPNDLPIFKEHSIGGPDATFSLSVRITSFAEYTIRTIIETPGFSSTEDWILQQLAGGLELYRQRDD